MGNGVLLGPDSIPKQPQRKMNYIAPEIVGLFLSRTVRSALNHGSK